MRFALLFSLAIIGATQTQAENGPTWMFPTEEGRMIIMGESINEEVEPNLPTPKIDHYFRVVTVFPLTYWDVNLEQEDCFVQVTNVPQPEGLDIDIDEWGNLFVKDLDGNFKSPHDVIVDIETCSGYAPEKATN